MFELIKQFPAQLLEAIELGEKIKLHNKPKGALRDVVICGLGGSGIGGDLLSELLRNELKLPVIVNKGYTLPGFVDEHSLLIICSYSGNTEEAISCADSALKAGLHPVCITSGGKLAEIAAKKSLDLVKIPAGSPPRCALGYSLTQLFFVLKHHQLITDDFKEGLIRSSSFMQIEQQKIMADAEFLASKILNKTIILYTEDAKEELRDAKQELNSEYPTFKTDAEAKIAANETRIAELRAKLAEPGKKPMDEMRKKRIDDLEERNAKLRARLNDYEKEHSDWEEFKREFNHDMEEIGKGFESIGEDNKK